MVTRLSRGLSRKSKLLSRLGALLGALALAYVAKRAGVSLSDLNIYP